MEKTEIKQDVTSWKILIPCRMVGTILGIIALLTFLTVALFLYQNYYVRALMYASYVGINIVLAYGFWKMKKWIVPILGGATFLVIILNSVNFLRGISKGGRAFAGTLIILALFLFAYFIRNFLNDEYRNKKAIGLFSALLIISWLTTFFLK